MRKSKSYKLKGIKFSASENYGFGTKKKSVGLPSLSFPGFFTSCLGELWKASEMERISFLFHWRILVNKLPD